MEHRRNQDKRHDKRIILQDKPKLGNKMGGKGVEVQGEGS